MKIAFTVCNRYQISHALVLADSLKQHNPDHRFFLGWVDQMQLPDLPDWVNAVPVDSLGIPEFTSMAQRYYHFELIAACTPFFAQNLLAAFPDCEELVFLAPTTQLFASLNLVADKSAFLQLSPQRLRPISAPDNRSIAPLDDKRILNTGMYQAGSWIMHPDGQQNAMLSWWGERMTDRAYFDLCEGMCLNQLWLNYLPIYYERVKTIRNPGWNYGLPGVPGSIFEHHHKEYLIDKNPLITLNYVGLESNDPVWSDHEDLVKNSAPWSDLRKSYRISLQDNVVKPDEVSLPYGMSKGVRLGRRYQTRAIIFLKNVISRIDNFDWAYN